MDRERRNELGGLFFAVGYFLILVIGGWDAAAGAGAMVLVAVISRKIADY